MFLTATNSREKISAITEPTTCNMTLTSKRQTTYHQSQPIPHRQWCTYPLTNKKLTSFDAHKERTNR